MEDEMTQWRPIGEAKKGKRLILYFPPTNAGRAQLGEMILVDIWPVAFPRQPTHWMPLPAPPASESTP